MVLLVSLHSLNAYVYTFKNRTPDTVNFKIPLKTCLQKSIKGHAAPNKTVKVQPKDWYNRGCCVDAGDLPIKSIKINGQKAKILVKFGKIWGDLHKAELGLMGAGMSLAVAGAATTMLFPPAGTAVLGASVVTLLADFGVIIAQTCRDMSFTLEKKKTVKKSTVEVGKTKKEVEVVFDYVLTIK